MATTVVPPGVTTDVADNGATTYITECLNNPTETTDDATGASGTVVDIRGTLKNVSRASSDFIVSLGISGGEFNQGTASFQVNSVGAGETVTWSTTGLVTNNPTQALSCSVLDVMSEPAA